LQTWMGLGMTMGNYCVDTIWILEGAVRVTIANGANGR
jgi:hypothetical protein